MPKKCLTKEQILQRCASCSRAGRLSVRHIASVLGVPNQQVVCL
ncbi:MAG: hypothetical protein ACLUUJ_09790 [Acutalibacteraceae bacterium]